MLTATLIGDVVASRRADDRSALHGRLVQLLEQVNEEFGPSTPLRFTIGDEFQGAFAGVGQALQASLRLRLGLLPDHDVRHGIGWGEVHLLQEQPRVEDGPGWWAARSAIEQVEGLERRAPLRAVRTAYVAADGEPGPDPALVNAALMTRDQIVSGLSERSMAVLEGLLAGRQQQEIADDLGISPSAVSQRVRADGLGVLLAADELVRAL